MEMDESHARNSGWCLTLRRHLDALGVQICVEVTTLDPRRTTELGEDQFSALMLFIKNAAALAAVFNCFWNFVIALGQFFPSGIATKRPPPGFIWILEDNLSC